MMPRLRLPGWLVLGFLVLAFGGASSAATRRDTILLDAGWRFAFGHATDRDRDFGHAKGYFSYLAKTGFGDGPAAANFDDRSWRRLDLPHDWAVEAPFSPSGSHSHGYKAIGPGFPERSIGWYRRKFAVANDDLGRRISVVFDGVFRAARVWVNGFYVGEQPSGTLDASYDVTDYLNYGGENFVAVRVDASMEEGWYYEGAGIYRHVWLVKTDPVHVARHGTVITTDVEDNRATIRVATTVANAGRAPASTTLEWRVVDAGGRDLVRAGHAGRELIAGDTATLTATLTIPSPQLWSLESPALHTLVTTLRESAGGAVFDETRTTFGIRAIRFDPDEGFFLNGRRVELRGTNNHQDHAGVGVALPDALQEFRLRRLQAMGGNAYRTSHHPPTPELLDACDRLGILVIDETRLMGSNAHHLDELAAMIRRDRNHPSVILWSIGNEEWAIEGNIKGARMAATMQAFARRLDPTRLTTCAISGGWGGIDTVIDVMGVNYIRHGSTDAQHAKYPRQVILGTEETTTQGTRGVYVDDRPRMRLAPVKDGSSGGNIETGWQHFAARPYLAGVFWWTGFDYRGEPTPFGFPAISTQFGILDTCGFPKDSFYYLQSWWTDETVLHVFPHWNWPGREGESIEVRAHSNCEQVELLLNGTSLGRQTMPANGHLAWAVPYTPGELVARGWRGGQTIATTRVATTGPVAAVQLTPDRTQLRADGRDVAVVTVAIADSTGSVVPDAHDLVQFSLTGPGRIIGVGNGDPASHEADRCIDEYAQAVVAGWSHTFNDAGDIVWSGTLERPAEIPPQTALTLFLSPVGDRQTVALNGSAVHTAANRAAARAELVLTHDQLRAGANRVDITANRPASPYIDPPSADAAIVRLVTPSDGWQRRVFFGLAQVIVQTTGDPGTIELRATSGALAPANMRLDAQP